MCIRDRRESADVPAELLSNGSRRAALVAPLSMMATGRTSGVSGPRPQETSRARWQSGRIAIKAKGRILLFNDSEAIAVEARGIYVLFVHTSSSHLLRASMAEMEEKLGPHGFVRIHRSVLVNAALVEEICLTRAGEYILRLKGEKEYGVTRTYKKNLLVLAQSWIGTDRFAVE